jgi:hypothetical protein
VTLGVIGLPVTLLVTGLLVTPRIRILVLTPRVTGAPESDESDSADSDPATICATNCLNAVTGSPAPASRAVRKAVPAGPELAATAGVPAEAVSDGAIAS